MKTILQPCSACGGTGFLEIWEVTSEKDANGYCIAVNRRQKCGTCGGKCYTEHAEFTVEEAQAILKHCGIITGEIGDI